MSTFEAGVAAAPVETYRVRLPTQRGWRVTIFDAHHRALTTVEDGREPHVDLPRGLYSVRVEGPVGFDEQAVRVDRDVDLSHLGPRRCSPTPLADSVLSHEYYAGPSEHWSRELTVAGQAPQSAALFIFIRAIDRDQAEDTATLATLSLHDQVGNVLSTLGPTETASDVDAGWLAYSAPLSAGFYRIREAAGVSRELGVQLVAGWQTQVFLLRTAGVVRLADARILMAPQGVGFKPSDAVTEQIDDALNLLRTPTARPPGELINSLIARKVDNPILGMLGAHLLLREMERLKRLQTLESADTPESSARVSLADKLNLVLTGLAARCGECADVRALRLAMRPPGDSERAAPFDVPPMLLAGFTRVVDAAASFPDLVSDAPLVDDIAENLFADSVWTTWAALLPRLPARAGDVSTTVSLEDVGGGAALKVGFQRNPWVRSGMLAAVGQELMRTQRLSREGKEAGELVVSITQLAQQLQVAPRLLHQAIGELDALSSDDVAAILGEERSSAVAPWVGGFSKLIKP